MRWTWPFELKPASHKTSAKFQISDYWSQLKLYDDALTPHGFDRGHSAGLVSYVPGGKPLGIFREGDTTYAVMAWPEDRPKMKESGLDGRGLIYYSLKELKREPPLTSPFFISVPKKNNHEEDIRVVNHELGELANHYISTEFAMAACSGMATGGIAYVGYQFMTRMSIGALLGSMGFAA